MGLLQLNEVPYARHYNPRFELFLPHFSFSLRFILDHLCPKNENSSFFKPKIRGLYMRAVSDQELVIMARVRYTVYKTFVAASFPDTFSFL